MTPDAVDVFKLVGGGGAIAALIYVYYLVGMRIVAALDRVSGKVDSHTAADLASHANMREDIAALHGKIDGLLDGQDRYTPVGVEIPHRPRTNPHGVPIGGYSQHRSGKVDR